MSAVLHACDLSMPEIRRDTFALARDLPYYDPTISEAAVDGLNRFAQASGLARRSVPYNQVVALEFRHLWTA